MNLIFKSLSAIAHLPILKLLNSVLGIVVGMAESIVVLWIIYIVIASFDTGRVGSQIAAWTVENEWLTKLYSDEPVRLLAGGIILMLRGL